MKRLLLFLLMLALALLTVCTLAAQTAPARLRVAHFAVDAPAVDVLADAAVIFDNLDYTRISDYIAVPAGTINLAIAPNDAGVAGAFAGPLALQLESGTDYTIAVIGLAANDSLSVVVINETDAFELVNGSDPATLAGKVRLLVLHGISDAPPVDVIVSGPTPTTLVSGLAFGTFTALVADPGDYPLLVTAAGNPDGVVFTDLNPVTLAGDQQYLVAAVGTFPANYQLVVGVTGTRNLYDTLSSVPELTTLKTAVDAIGFGSVISNQGPFTVFAPTNDAFNALPAGTLDALLADVPTLRMILLYHIAPGILDLTELTALPTLTSVAGLDLPVAVQNETVQVGGVALVVRGNIYASNGVIHLIDTVLQPSTP